MSKRAPAGLLPKHPWWPWLRPAKARLELELCGVLLPGQQGPSFRRHRLLPPKVLISRKLELEVESGFKSRDSTMEFEYP